MSEYGATQELQVIDDLSRHADAPVTVSVAADAGRLPIIRSVVERALFLGDWTIDDVADLKLSVDEVCSQLVAESAADRRIEVSIAVAPTGAVCQIEGAIDDGRELNSTGFGWHIVETVTEAQSISYVDIKGERQVSVRFAKRRTETEDGGDS